MLRTLLAVIAITFFAGSAWAVDDSTSENDAIQLDQGTEPYSPGSSMKKAPPAAGSSDSGDLEIQEFDRETNQ